MGADRSAIRRDDRGPLRSGHCVQLRAFAAPQYLPGGLAAGGVLVSAAEQAARFLDGLGPSPPACHGTPRCGADHLVLVDPRILRAVAKPRARCAAHRRAGDAASLRRAVRAARRARCDRGGLLSRSPSFRRGTVGARGRQHFAFRGGAAEWGGRNLCRGRVAPGGGHPRPVQLRACKLARDDAAVLPNLRISLQSHAAASARPPLLDDRLQPRRQDRHPQRDRRADAHQRPAIPALARGAGNRRGRFHVRCMRLPPEGDPRSTDARRTNGGTTRAFRR